MIHSSINHFQHVREICQSKIKFHCRLALAIWMKCMTTRILMWCHIMKVNIEVDSMRIFISCLQSNIYGVPVPSIDLFVLSRQRLSLSSLQKSTCCIYSRCENIIFLIFGNIHYIWIINVARGYIYRVTSALDGILDTTWNEHSKINVCAQPASIGRVNFVFELAWCARVDVLRAQDPWEKHKSLLAAWNFATPLNNCKI